MQSSDHPNPHRGDVCLVINGKRHILRLTLGALASLEERLEAGSLMGLAERFESGRVKTHEMIALLGAGLRGAGSDLGEDDLIRADIDGGAVGAMRAAMELLGRAFQPLSHDE